MIISKIAAAQNQLETAIDLYFDDKDFVSVHTLASASHVILSNLSHKAELVSWFRSKEQVREFLPEMDFTAYLNRISAAQNFFKHADKPDENPLKEIEFNPGLSELFILDSIQMFQNLTKDLSVKMAYFKVWFGINNPEIYKLNEELLELIKTLKGNVTKSVYADYVKMPESQIILEQLRISILASS